MTTGTNSSPPPPPPSEVRYEDSFGSQTPETDRVRESTSRSDTRRFVRGRFSFESDREKFEGERGFVCGSVAERRFRVKGSHKSRSFSCRRKVRGRGFVQKRNGLTKKI